MAINVKAEQRCSKIWTKQYLPVHDPLLIIRDYKASPIEAFSKTPKSSKVTAEERRFLGVHKCTGYSLCVSWVVTVICFFYCKSYEGGCWAIFKTVQGQKKNNCRKSVVYGEKNRENALHFPSPVKKKLLNKLFPTIMYNPKLRKKVHAPENCPSQRYLIN